MRLNVTSTLLHFNILIIRCQHLHLTYLAQKINKPILYPLYNFNLAHYTNSYDKNLVYEAFGIINHTGNLYGGHYYSYCKFRDDEKWYEFNDAMITPLNEDNINLNYTYIIFYRLVEKKL